MTKLQHDSLVIWLSTDLTRCWQLLQTANSFDIFYKLPTASTAFTTCRQQNRKLQQGALSWYLLSKSKHWANPRQRVLWINPVANISFPLITPGIAGFDFRSYYPLYSIYVHCRKGRKYCYGDSEGEYCHCDYCKCKHGYGLKVALFYFWLVYSTSWT